MTEILDSRRLALVRAAQQRWIAALTDLGGRNTLLYYKDRRAGTLDLAQADPEALDRFTETGSIRLTRLFKDVDLRADAIRRVQAIHRKARELLRRSAASAPGTWPPAWPAGTSCSWSPPRPCCSRAHHRPDPGPIRRLRAHPGRRRGGQSRPGAQAHHRVRGRADQADPGERVHRLQLAAHAAEVPGFEITDRQVIGTFTYAKLPMVRDMEAAGDLLAESDLVAAIAGDPEAQELVRPTFGRPDARSPEGDYSVLDADSSQRHAIDTVPPARAWLSTARPGRARARRSPTLSPR